MTGTLPAAYFDQLYGRDPDPWRFETSAYERDKYADTLAHLPRARYDRVLEVGCANGLLTRQLAPRADRLTAIDIAEPALAAARERLKDMPEVDVLKAGLPDSLPDGPFDLILLSEVLYYLDAQDLARAAGAVLARLAPGGDVVLVHWLGDTPEYPLSGDEAAEGFLAAVRGRLTTGTPLRRDRYRLDRLRRLA